MSRIRRLYNMDLGIRQSYLGASGGNAVHDDLVRFSLSIYPCCLKKSRSHNMGIAIDRCTGGVALVYRSAKSRVAEPAAQTRATISANPVCVGGGNSTLSQMLPKKHINTYRVTLRRLLNPHHYPSGSQQEVSITTCCWFRFNRAQVDTPGCGMPFMEMDFF